MALPEITPTDPWIPQDTFGGRLAQIRQELRWNVKHAAEACGLNDQSWRNWEAGGLPRDLVATAKTIAQVTGCNERWLVLGQNWTKNKGADLRIVDGEAEDSQPGPGQMELPFRGLRVVR